MLRFINIFWKTSWVGKLPNFLNYQLSQKKLLATGFNQTLRREQARDDTNTYGPQAAFGSGRGRESID